MSATAEGVFRGRQPTAVNHALDIIGVIAESGPGISAAEIGRALQLSRATTYRILKHLVQEEYIVRSPDLTGYCLGAGLVAQAQAIVRQAQSQAQSQAQAQTTATRDEHCESR